MNVGVIGLGKLGLPFAETLALRHEVVGYDVASRSSGAFEIAPSIAAASERADTVFVVLPTPHDPEYEGSSPTTHLPPRDFAYDHIVAVLTEIDEVIRDGASIAVVSTVLPGTIRREFAAVASRGELLYTPAFMAMGRVREDFLDPEFRLLGSADGDPAAGASLRELWASFERDAPVHHRTWEEAESIKIFYNAFISFKLAFVNTIQDVAERVGHVDVDAVTEVFAGATGRLFSPMYLKAGLGDGGPCHPRDLIALRHLAAHHELGYDLFGAIAAAREAQAKNLADHLAGYGLPVLITSRSFKPGVPYADGSPSLLVAHYAREAGCLVAFLEDLAEPPDEPQVVLLAHDLDHDRLDLPAGSVVVDPWRRYRDPELRVVHYGETRLRDGASARTCA